MMCVFLFTVYTKGVSAPVRCWKRRNWGPVHFGIRLLGTSFMRHEYFGRMILVRVCLFSNVTRLLGWYVG